MMICKLEEPSVWISQLKLRMSNDVEKNPGPKSPSKRSDPEKKKSKLKRSKSSVRDSGLSSASSASPSIPDERKEEETESIENIIDEKEDFPVEKVDDEKVKQLEKEIETLQSQLLSVDQNVEKLINSIETLRPLYIQAKEALNSFENQTQKNNLVFHGIKPDKLENDMAGEPDFCRDILETRIKGILKEHLKISRDISFLQVKRIDTGEVSGVKPCIVSFTNWKDKQNVLRQAKLLKGCGIYITEDITNKSNGAKGKLRRSSSVASAGVKGFIGSNGKMKEAEEVSIAESEYTSSASGTD